MKAIPLVIICVITCFPATSQTSADSTRTLDSITIKAFEQYKPVPYSPISITVLPYADFSPKTSLVHGLNVVAGVRMEERSPGSYRLSIRGSSLRSPFGVRNIKVYWNNIPITDPGGNTYFNQFSWNSFAQAEIFKGPAASLYGTANGGLVLLNSWDNRWQPGVSAEYITGSYDLHNTFLSARFGKRENKNLVTYAHNQTDGYRVHTNMRRDNFSWVSKTSKGQYDISTAVLFTDMYYQTPGALTFNEFNNDPKAARPAAGGLPSAVNAKAAIYQKNVLAGMSGVFRLVPDFKNTTTIYGAFAQIKNPAIRNYERRNEPSFGGRSVFDFQKKREKISLGFFAGTEWQQGYFNTQVSKNKNGNPDTLLANDDVNNTALSFFGQVTADIDDKWFLLAALSVNKTKISITRLNQYPVLIQSRTYRNETAPLLTQFQKYCLPLVLLPQALKLSGDGTMKVHWFFIY
jgi:iron complex outermembrane recepter protein